MKEMGIPMLWSAVEGGGGSAANDTFQLNNVEWRKRLSREGTGVVLLSSKEVRIMDWFLMEKKR